MKQCETTFHYCNKHLSSQKVFWGRDSQFWRFQPVSLLVLLALAGTSWCECVAKQPIQLMVGNEREREHVFCQPVTNMRCYHQSPTALFKGMCVMTYSLSIGPHFESCHHLQWQHLSLSLWETFQLQTIAEANISWCDTIYKTLR